ncbi:restriction endonuclease subunit S [Pseudomonas anguilliseptica]|uniref:restriction endonuclease subunit S n=1 Tax=Pseudomonas anguilliseptica TaxID=53406 RepID=UPI003736309D
MDAQQFLTEFEHIAGAPRGIKRLRELIYQFAVTGRLVSQQLEEGDADAVLENVARVRRQLVSEKRFKRVAKLESEHLIPPAIDLPPSWRWSRLLDLGEINPRNRAAGDAGATFVPMANVSDKHGEAVDGDETIWADISKGYTHFANGDVLLAKISPCFENGKAAVVSGLKYGIGSGSTEFHVFRPICEDVNPAFAYLFLRSPLFRAKGQLSMTGTAGQKRLPTDYFALCAMPLPPKLEQGRIVSKVNDLMLLCDKLELQQQNRRKLQNTLRHSFLQAVTSAQSPHELQYSWLRLKKNFNRLFSEPRDVEAFKGLVLDLAINGRLLPPWQKSTSTGHEVLEAIAVARANWTENSNGQEKKEALGVQKKLRTQGVASSSTPLPKHWCWATLLQVSQAVVDCHNKTARYTSEGIHLVRTTDIRNGHMDLTKTKKISEETYEFWAKRMPPRAGDIFFTREAPMGEAAIVPYGEKVCLGQRTMLIRLFHQHFSNRFLLYALMSPSFQARMADAAIGMTVKHLRVGGVEDLVIPVPPKSEQDQIVSSIERLFDICDRYAKNLDNLFRLAGSLASSTVGLLTGTTLNEKDEPVKVPQTELISLLHLGLAPSIKEQAPLATILAQHNGALSAQDLWKRSTLGIDAFYAQLKAEIARNWITEPAIATVREKPVERTEA